MHFIYSLKPAKGKGAIILPHGVLFRGNAEATIRKEIIKKRFIKGIIGLPANLFYGTGIPACIIVIDKENSAERTGIFMIDASREFIKDGNKNRLREQDIRKIVDYFNGQITNSAYSRLVPYSEIEEKNDYNLNISRYIDAGDKEDLQDIEAHLKGGFPVHDIDELQLYWNSFSTLRYELFEDCDCNNYCNLKLKQEDIRNTIFGNPEFKTYAKSVATEFENFKTAQYSRFSKLTKGDNPKKFIELVATAILHQFSTLTLLNKYDVYQILMEYWEEAMQDDVYAVAFDGWESGNEIVREYAIKKGKNSDIVKTDRVKTWDGRMIPKTLIIDEYFPEKRDAIIALETKRDEVLQCMEEMREEHGSEDGLLFAVIEKEKISAKRIKDRIREIQQNVDNDEELNVLQNYEKLMYNESTFNTAIKNAVAELEQLVIQKYPTLSLKEIKTLVIDKKWCVVLFARINELFSSLSHHLAGRISELSERYADTLPELEKQVKESEKKVKSHLKKMGFVW